MQLVEQHVIDKNDPRYSVIDEAAFQPKNLYNVGNYEVRQSYIQTGMYLTYNEVQRRMQSHEAYKALPVKVSHYVLLVLDRTWISFKEALKVYEEAPSKFTGGPPLPTDQHKAEGRTVLVDTLPTLSNGTTGRAGSRQA